MKLLLTKIQDTVFSGKSGKCRRRRVHNSRPLASNVSLLEQRTLLVASLDPFKSELVSSLAELQAGPIDAQVLSKDLPLVGGQLSTSQPLQFLTMLSQRASTEFGKIAHSNASPIEIKNAIATAFGISSSTISIKNQNGSAVTTLAEVASAERVEVEFLATGTLTTSTVDFAIGSNFSGLGLNLSAGGKVSVDLSYSAPITMGLDSRGFYMDFSRTNDLSFTVVAVPTKLDVDGQLGFLNVNAKDSLNASGNNAFASHLNATFDVNLDGARVYDANLSANGATAKLTADTDLSLLIAASVPNSTINPKLTTVLTVDWDFMDSDIESGQLGTVPNVHFSEITIDRASLFQGLIAPYLNEVEKAVKPIKDLADIFLARPISQLPVSYLDLFEFAMKVSAASDEINLDTLLSILKNDPSDLKLMLTRVKSIGEFLESVRSGANGPAFTVGSFSPVQDIRTAAISAAGAGATSIMSQIGGGSFTSSLDKFNSDGKAGSSFQSQFDINILSDTSNAIKLLTGDQSARIVSYELTATYSATPTPYKFTTFVGIVPVKFQIGGQLSLAVNLKTGYDATGFGAFKASKAASDLLNGFYVDTSSNLSLSPKVTFSVTGGFTDDTILDLIKQYTQVSIPGWVLDVAGFHPTLAVKGEANLTADVVFSLRDAPGSNDGRLHYNEITKTLSRGINNSFDTNGQIVFDASAKFIYGMKAELPGKKVLDKLGIGKFVDGAKFEAGGSLNLIDPFRIVLYDFNTDSAGSRADLSSAAPTPPVPSIVVTGASAHPTDRDTWLVNEGSSIGLFGSAVSQSASAGLEYKWRQLTGDELYGYATPPADLLDSNQRSATFRPLVFSAFGNPQSRPFFSLVGVEDRYFVELTVKDPATGLSGRKVLTIVAQEVNPTVSKPTTNINGVDTGLVGVRSFELGMQAKFSDPGSKDFFNSNFGFGDGDSATKKGMTLARTATSHVYTSAGNYSVTTTIEDGFLEFDPPSAPVLGKGAASSIVRILKVAVLPDQADASRTALYIGGTASSETIVVKRNPATNRLLVTMPDFSGELEIPTGHIYVNGGGGQDTIEFDYTGGMFLPPRYSRVNSSGASYSDAGGAVIDGGGGTNVFKARGGSFSLVGTGFSVDSNGIARTGFVDYDGGLVSLINVPEIQDLTSAQQISFSANVDNDSLSFEDGRRIDGALTSLISNGSMGSRGRVFFAGKELVLVSGGKGQDSFHVSSSSAASPMRELRLFGTAIDDEDNVTDTFLIDAIDIVTKVFGEGGDDLVSVGSERNESDGNLDRIRQRLYVYGSNGDDKLYVNDQAKLGRANFALTPTFLEDLSVGSQLRTSDVTPSRALFAGISYDGSTELVEVDANDSANVFSVSPSAFTEFLLNGHAPTAGPSFATFGDSLLLDVDGTAGRHLSITQRASGFWSFSSNHKNVSFTGIERFNHVDVVAIPEPAGKGSKPRVRVFDAETKEFKFEFLAYEANYEGGVSVAVGDVNEDGLPDIVTAPGRLHVPEVRVFDGTPQSGLTGSRIAGLTIPGASTYGATYSWGVNVAVGDVNGDGGNDIVTAPRRNVDNIKVFQNDVPKSGLVPFKQVRNFDAFADLPTYIGGANIAVADLDGELDGNSRGDIIVGNGSGIAGQVRIFDVVLNAAAYSPKRVIRDSDTQSLFGLYVAAGDIDGNGNQEIFTSGLSRGMSFVKAYSGAANGSSTPLWSHQAFTDLSLTAPAWISVNDFDFDGNDEFYVHQMEDGRNASDVRIIESSNRSRIGTISTLKSAVPDTALQLDRDLSLTSTGNYQLNWGGLNEKWIQGSNSTWYFVTPDGKLHQWFGGNASNNKVIAELRAFYYEVPELLHKAFETYSAANADFAQKLPKSTAAALDSGLLLTKAATDRFNSAGLNERWLSGNGGWYYITPLGDFYQSNVSNPSERTWLGRVDSRFNRNIGALAGASVAAGLDKSLNLTLSTISQNSGGLNEKWLKGSDGKSYFITSNGKFYQSNGTQNIASSTLLQQLDSDYYNALDLLAEASLL